MNMRMPNVRSDTAPLKQRRQQLGVGLIGWMIALPILLVVLVVLAVLFYEGRKAYWDNRVTEMCEKDGGAIVFENIEITQDDYKKLGGVNGVIPVSNENLKKCIHPILQELQQKY